MDLVRRAQTGDLEAFEMLVEHHAPGLYRLAAAIVSESDAADLVQDTFVSAWNQLSRLRNPEAFAGWLSRICINQCRNHLRARGRAAVSLEAASAEMGTLPHLDFRDAVHDRALIGTYFNRLNPEQRAMVILHYGAGMSIAQSADAIGIRVGTAKSRLNGALGVFRRALGASPQPAPEEAEVMR